MDKTGIANRVSVVTIIVNIILSVFKFTAGILCGSAALISDAVHSASDVLSTFAVIAGVNISARDSDKEHRYGHERIEEIFSVILSVILFATGIGIGIEGIREIGIVKEAPGMLALWAAFISIVIKEAMYHYTRMAADKINSNALRADAWHHRSDALSSVGSFIGVLASRAGFAAGDSIAAVVICIFIIIAAWKIFKDSIDRLIDKSCDTKTERMIYDNIISQNGVIAVDDLKTRLFGAKIYVDVEISAEGSLSLYEAHEIAHKVHDSVENGFRDVKHCMVHVNPAKSIDK